MTAAHLHRGMCPGDPIVEDAQAAGFPLARPQWWRDLSCPACQALEWPAVDAPTEGENLGVYRARVGLSDSDTWIARSMWWRAGQWTRDEDVPPADPAPVATVPAPDRGSCPCQHTTPCDPHCTCVSPFSSRGCDRCCAYGSPEQQRAAAERLAAATERAAAAERRAARWKRGAKASRFAFFALLRDQRPIFARMRESLGLVRGATVEQIAEYLDDAVRDRDRLHQEKIDAIYGEGGSEQSKARADAAEAGAAAMRSALEALIIAEEKDECFGMGGYGDAVRTALATDAGRELAARVVKLEADLADARRLAVASELRSIKLRGDGGKTIGEVEDATRLAKLEAVAAALPRCEHSGPTDERCTNPATRWWYDENDSADDMRTCDVHQCNNATEHGDLSYAAALRALSATAAPAPVHDPHSCCPSHCCAEHGCKYGHFDCPVVTRKVVQQNACEECAPAGGDHSTGGDGGTGGEKR